MRNQRKRNKHPPTADPMGEAVGSLVTALSDLSGVEQPATPPPDGVSDARKIGGVGRLNDTELQELQSKIDAIHGAYVGIQGQWETFEGQLRVALDATQRVKALRAATPSVEPEPKKRRKDSAADLNAIQIGSQVAYRLPRSADDAWILCEVTKILQEGQRYEVRDPEPDEQGNPGKIFRASVRDLIALPKPGQHLPTYAPGAEVLAQYPDTTAFYNATVTNVVGAGARKYRLLFEGEEDSGTEKEVPAALVISRKS